MALGRRGDLRGRRLGRRVIGRLDGRLVTGVPAGCCARLCDRQSGTLCCGRVAGEGSSGVGKRLRGA